MSRIYYFKVLCIFHLVQSCSCWMYFVPLKNIYEMKQDEDMVPHSEYIYGDCERRDIKHYTSVHLNAIDILGKVIVRGWLQIRRIPTCIKIRAMSYEEDTFRNTAYNFQICVPRISYCHSHYRFLHFYYEWYIPTDFHGGMNWDLHFYGPIDLDW